MLGKLSWSAIPFDQPIPLITSLVIIAIVLGALVYVAAKGWLPYLWREWITTVDHKRIGIMYCLLGVLMLVRGFADAVMMRTQQAVAINGPGYLPPEHYNQIFSAHGTIMIFFAAMPLVIGFMNFVTPLQLGVRDVAFPTMNSVSFWLTAAGALLVNVSLFIGEFARTGWLPYPPLSEVNYSPGVGVDYYLWAVQISGIGTMMTGINFVTTVLKMRCTGMSYLRMPMFCWTTLASSLIIVAVFPILTATLAMLTLDRYLGFHFFTSTGGGNPMMFMNLIWAWGHPEVYILVLPAFGIFSEVFSTFSGKPLFGYRSMVAATLFICVVSMNMSEGEIAHRVGTLHRSGIRRVMAQAAERERAGQKIIHLEVGQPDFPTPPHIIDAAFKAARAGATGYTPNAGIMSLREAVAERVTSRTGRKVDARNVSITSGAVNAIMLALAAVVEPGAEVLIPDPGWPNYRSAVTLVGARSVPYPLDRANEFKVDIKALEGLITPATSAILVNTPSNPTGTLLSKAEVQAIQRLAHKHGLWIISDEVYEDFVFGGLRHETFFTPNADSRVLLVSGASKSWAMTGFRIGWLVGDPSVIEAAGALAEPQTSCPSIVSQVAAEAAVRGPQAAVEAMRQAYEARASIVENTLGDSGLLLAQPKGAFYAMIDTTATGIPDDRFVEALMAEHGVAVAPGDTFGTQASGSIRVSLASADIELSAGLSRIERFISKSRARD